MGYDRAGQQGVELDGEGRALRLAAERTEYREAITKAEQTPPDARISAPQATAPKGGGDPTGKVTLDKGAGAFAPWLAHRTLAVAAEKIAKEVASILNSEQQEQQGQVKDARRVLVVDSRDLLGGDVTARLVRDGLTVLHERLEELATTVKDAREGLSQPQPEGQGEGGGPEGQGEGGVLETGMAHEKARPPQTPTPARPGLGGAADLLSLVRTDYAVVAATVTTSPSELSTLTAGQLAKKLGNTAIVQVPGLAKAKDKDSACMSKYAAVGTQRRRVKTELTELEMQLAPLEAKLTALRAWQDRLEEAWSAAAAPAQSADYHARLEAQGNDLANKVANLIVTAAPAASADDRAELKKDRDKRANDAARLAATTAPARTVAERAQRVLGEVDAVLRGLVEATPGGEPALFTAARWEQLTGDEVSHVLYVATDQVAADIVTRRSLLGTSAHLGFLAGASTSWLLVEPSGRIKAGDSATPACRLRYDLLSGKSDERNVLGSDTLEDDPMLRLETWTTRLVIGASFFLVVLFIVGLVRIALNL